MGNEQRTDSSKEALGAQGNGTLSQPAHALTFAQVRDELQTDTALGLSADEASARLLKYGSNSFEEEKGVQPLQILIAQVANAMTLVRS
jgi:magnesium-transporting ATPase (P-type)